VRHAPTPPEAAQGRALLKKLDASKDEWGAIYAVSRKPADLKGTRVNFIALNLLDVEVRMHACYCQHTYCDIAGAMCRRCGGAQNTPRTDANLYHCRESGTSLRSLAQKLRMSSMWHSQVRSCS